MSDGPFKQAERLPVDGPVHVVRVGDDRIAIRVTTNGEEQVIVCSCFNASRMFALVGFMLGIKLPSSLGKAIKL